MKYVYIYEALNIKYELYTLLIKFKGASAFWNAAFIESSFSVITQIRLTIRFSRTSSNSLNV